MIGNIYRLTSPSGKSYIGQTIELNKRMRQYSKLNCVGQHKIYNAILKYGFENFKIDVLFQYSSDNRDRLNIVLDAIEKFCIKKYKCVEQGYNIRLGGSGGKCTEETLERMRFAQSNRSEETRRKMSEWQKGRKLPALARENSRKTNTGRPMPQHVKDATRKANIGRKITEEHRRKLIEINTGKVMSSETRAKISAAGLGRKHTSEAIQKIINANLNISEETREKSRASRARTLENNTKSRKEINNGKWFTDEGRDRVRLAAMIGTSVIQLSLSGEYVNCFKSLKEAERCTDSSLGEIRNSIKNKNIRNPKFKWILMGEYNNLNKYKYESTI